MLIDIVPEDVYNAYMAQTFYDRPVTVRLGPDELAILEQIRSEFGRPGLELSMADAFKVALHEWALAHPVKAESEV